MLALIHGLGQSDTSWFEVIKNLNTKEEIYNPNLFELVEEKTYDKIYKALAKKLNQKEEKVFLCGLSLGGILALNYAIDYPEKVEKLILIASQYKMPKFLLKLQNIMFKLMPEKSFTELGISKDEFIKLMKSTMDIDFSSDLNKVKCPVLVVVGEKDKANLKAAKELSEAFNEDVTIVPKAGHVLNEDSPESLAELLNNFIE